MANMLSTIPFPCKSFQEASVLKDRMIEDGIVVETRADWLQIVQAPQGDFEDNKWYVVVHTGNLTGTIHDLSVNSYI